MKKFKELFNLSIGAWCLYDWALAAFPTVIITFVFATYYTEKVATNNIIGTREWGAMIGIAGLIIAVLSPALGILGDYYRRRKPWLALFTVLIVLASGLLWYSYPNSAFAHRSLMVVGLGLLGVELGMVFYNALLNDITPKKFIGRISGIGWGVGYLGGILCLLIVFSVFVKGKGAFFNLNSVVYENIRAVGPFVGLWLTFFSMPLFLFTKERAHQNFSRKNPLKQGFFILITSLKELRHYPQIAIFLLANMFYMDGLKTIFAFGGIFAAGTFGFTLDQVVLLGINMNILAGIGAITFAWLDDLWGTKKTILLSLILMICFSIAALMTHTKALFTMAALGLSLFVGPIQAASRSLILKMSPQAITTEMLGLFNLSGRVTAFMGPWLFGSLTFAFGSQRYGMVVPLVFLMLGFVTLSFLRPQRPL